MVIERKPARIVNGKKVYDSTPIPMKWEDLPSTILAALIRVSIDKTMVKSIARRADNLKIMIYYKAKETKPQHWVKDKSGWKLLIKKE